MSISEFSRRANAVVHAWASSLDDTETTTRNVELDSALSAQEEAGLTLLEAVMSRVGFLPTFSLDSHSHFDSDGWIYKGTCRIVCCPTCNTTRLLIWRKPTQLYGIRKYWAMVCPICNLILGSDQFSNSQMEVLRGWYAALHPDEPSAIIGGRPIEDAPVVNVALEDLVCIEFKYPVEGTDPIEGDVVVADRHRIDATSVQMDLAFVTLIGEGGEILAQWPTDSVSTIRWTTPSISTNVEMEVTHIASPPDTGRKWRRWDSDEESQLRSEFTQELTIEEIATAHGRSKGAINNRLAKLGLIPDSPTLIGFSDRALTTQVSEAGNATETSTGPPDLRSRDSQVPDCASTPDEEPF